MIQENRSELKSYFQTGDRPTQEQFEKLIDSIINFKEDEISVDDSTKNIGIGVDDPQTKLHIDGALRGNRNGALRIDTGSGELIIGPQDAVNCQINTDVSRFLFNKSITTSGGAFSSSSGVDLSLNTGGTTHLTIQNSTGNVGIGTITPNADLSVVGTIRTANTDVENNYLQMQHDGTNAILESSGDTLDIKTSSAAYMRLNGQTLEFLNSGSSVFIGEGAGASTTGGSNTFVGSGAGFENTGIQNSFFGADAGSKNTGRKNVFIGHSAGKLHESGDVNIFIGYQAGESSEGEANNFVGTGAGLSNTGSYNLFFGADAGKINKGDNNVFVGHSAGSTHEIGDGNTFLGYRAGQSNSVGAGNVFIGFQAGYNEMGSNKLYIANSSTTTPLIGGDFSTGNVGIGTAEPENSNGWERVLDVHGSNNARLILTTESSSNPFPQTGGIQMGVFSHNNWYGDEAGLIGTETAHNLHLITSYSTRMTIDRDGNVGIGTASPTNGKVHIEGSQGYTVQSPHGHFDESSTSFSTAGVSGIDCSLWASGSIASQRVYAFSDTRIKNIIGLSDRNKDLNILNNIQIMDYTYKDVVKNGTQKAKKVIAQQVAEVFPQVVTSNITEVIPDIMQKTTIVKGVVSLKDHDIKVKDRIKLIFADGENAIHEVVTITTDSFTLKLDRTEEVFVYGREVNDFHLVDFEAISMLNVSATQALHDKIKKQERQIKALNTRYANLVKRIKILES